MSRFLPSDSSRAEHRRRWSHGSVERHTGQSHRSCGTPVEVPVPRKVSRISGMCLEIVYKFFNEIVCWFLGSFWPISNLSSVTMPASPPSSTFKIPSKTALKICWKKFQTISWMFNWVMLLVMACQQPIFKYEIDSVGISPTLIGRRMVMPPVDT